MKQLLISVLILSVFALAVNADPATIKQIIVEKTTGVTANYNADSGSLNWSGGAAAIVILQSGQMGLFGDAEVDFNFERTSPAAQTNAMFDMIGTWSIDLKYAGATALYVEGIIEAVSPFNGKYYEEITGTNAMYGATWLTVQELIVNKPEVFDNNWGTGTQFEWYGGNTVGMASDITLTTGVFDTYEDSYNTDVVDITLYADEEQVVPEPATMALLALGGLVFVRKNK